MGLKPESVLASIKSGGYVPNEVPLALRLILEEGLEGKGVVGEVTVDLLVEQAIQAHATCHTSPEGDKGRKKIREALYKAIRIIHDFDTKNQRAAVG